MNLSQKLLQTHLLSGELIAGQEITLRVDQSLMQDATGTLVMLELENLALDHIQVPLAVQYIDHNLIQEDYKNADDHVFLLTASQRFGLWYSRAGNGVSHIVHMQYFSRPGQFLLGADSHTCANGSMGMLAIGAGGLEVALALAGGGFHLKMPKIFGIRLIGQLPDWLSAKDIILEVLRRHDVSGAIDHILEYHGPGLQHLSAMDRHVLANMGAELGATASVFPADEQTLAYLQQQGRPQDWHALSADADCDYDRFDQIDLSQLKPLIALPSSPGKVVAVSEVEGLAISQAYIGSSANPGYRDYAICALMVKGRSIPAQVSFDINPSSRAILTALMEEGHLAHLIRAGARLHQTGCNGCIGMGQAPASNGISLRTVPRNFKGRSGTSEDSVYLCSPETATASALMAKITDPRHLDMPYPTVSPPRHYQLDWHVMVAPINRQRAHSIELQKGPNIGSLPNTPAVPPQFSAPILLKVGDHVSTDDILPAGVRALPYRSNIPKISEFCFEHIDPSYVTRAKESSLSGHIIVAGDNYGQGSSREHAALAPRYLGLILVIAKSFARIHWQNLINHGILALTFSQPDDYGLINPGDVLTVSQLYEALRQGPQVTLLCANRNKTVLLEHSLSARQIDVLEAGGIIPYLKHQAEASGSVNA